jgi:hypothetical protein
MIKYKSLKKILLMAQPKWNVVGLPPPMPMTCDKFNQKALVKVNKWCQRLDMWSNTERHMLIARRPND